VMLHVCLSLHLRKIRSLGAYQRQAVHPRQMKFPAPKLRHGITNPVVLDSLVETGLERNGWT
jgi:hypothetical protein